LNVCGAQEFTTICGGDRILYVRAIQGVEQIKSTKVSIDNRYLRDITRSLLLAKTSDEEISCPNSRLKCSRHGTSCHRSWKTDGTAVRRRFHFGANWSTAIEDIICAAKILWSKSREFMRFVNAREYPGKHLSGHSIKDEKTRTSFRSRLALSLPRPERQLLIIAITLPIQAEFTWQGSIVD